MANGPKQQWPEVREISANDLVDIVGAGLNDFRLAPKYGLFFASLYVAAGWLLMILLFYFGLPYLAYPLAMGFALIAPFAGVAFYSVSDKLEKGEPLSWGIVFNSIKECLKRDVRWMALVTGFALVIWMDIAAFLFFGFMGFNGIGPDFFEKLFMTPSGLMFVLLGNTAGAVIALTLFSISVVSFPMLYDRDVDFVTAMVTSVRLVIKNPFSMIAWCAFIGILTVLSLLSAFIGFLVVLPVIGHASWHLYRKAVEPSATAEPDTASAVSA